jgi:predicted HicB family RNase H-like nuclease
MNGQNRTRRTLMRQEERDVPLRAGPRKLQVRLSPEKYARFREAAEKDGRSLSGWVRHHLIAAVAAELG